MGNNMAHRPPLLTLIARSRITRHKDYSLICRCLKDCFNIPEEFVSHTIQIFISNITYYVSVGLLTSKYRSQIDFHHMYLFFLFQTDKLNPAF